MGISETVRTRPVDNSVGEDVFHSLIGILNEHGELREIEGKAVIVAIGSDGSEISVASPFSLQNLQLLCGDGLTEKDIFLEGPTRIRISGKTQSGSAAEALTLVKFNPGRMRTTPEDDVKSQVREIREAGVQYSVSGPGTPQSQKERIEQVISGWK